MISIKDDFGSIRIFFSILNRSVSSQVSANLDLQARKEHLGALCRHQVGKRKLISHKHTVLWCLCMAFGALYFVSQKPSLLDHPDLQDPRGRKGHGVGAEDQMNIDD